MIDLFPYIGIAARHLHRAGLLLLCLAVLSSCGPKHVEKSLSSNGEYKTLNDQGAVLISQGRYEEALEMVEAALAIKPDYSFAWNNKSVIFLGLGKTDEALDAADRALKINPLNAAAWSNKSMVYRNTARMNDALQAMDRALLIEPRNALFLYNKACYQALAGDRDGALGSIEKAAKLDPRIKAAAARDEDLESLRSDPRFKKLTE